MRRISIKLRVTLWYTALMILMAALLIGFMFAVSDAVVVGDAQETLEQTVKGNVDKVTMPEGNLTIGNDFVFYTNGVYTLIYNNDEALMAGQVPLEFKSDDEFTNAQFHQVESAEGEVYFVYDLWLQLDWDNGVWIRGVMSSPSEMSVVRNILHISLFALPFIILFAVIGGYLLTRRAFLPIDKMLKTAETIGESGNLSERIALPEGKDEFSRLSASFDRMFDQLENAFEAEKQFTSDASHELRTPTAIILAECDYIKKHGKGMEDYQEAMEVIKRQANRMSEMINQLLNITRIEQGTQKINIERTNLSELADAVLKERLDGNPKNVLLYTNIEPNISVEVDRLLISRLIGNIAENACKYGKENGSLYVDIQKEADSVLMKFKDDGIGIAEEEQEKIWLRFYQADESRSENSGVGLGLFMVRQIAELHGGKVWLESKLGKGSTFFVRLPLQHK